jgi:Ca2+/H+ antiporter, TMEM165/GDT1 family
MWEYLTVFALAATPFVELLVVIPLGIGYGLNPVAVGATTFAGNALPIVVIAAAYERFRTWRSTRMAATPDSVTEEAGDGHTGGGPDATGARGRRARRVWLRYGLPGLALLAPLATGVHVAALAALAFGAPRPRVVAWMLFSIAVWTVGITVISVAGIEGVRQIFGDG